MKKFLKVTDFYKKHGSQNRIIYVNDKGELFDGPEHDVVVGYTYAVEVATKKFEDYYYNIIKFISKGKKVS
jgi:hypothetical protein